MKKLALILLALLMTLSLVACGGNSNGSKTSSAADSTASSEPTAEPEDESVASEPASEAAAATALKPNSDLPDIDGYTKTEQSGVLMYTDPTGSALMVMRMPSDAAAIQGFMSKDKATEDQLNAQMSSTLASIMPGAEAKGSFSTVEGRDVFAVTLDSEQAKVTEYMLAGDGEFVIVLGTGNKDVSGDLAKLVKAL